jgi:hypothetical protein
MNLVALLILPAVINLEDNDAARYAISGGALVVLLIAIFWSKRGSATLQANEEAIEEADEPATPAAHV